MKGYQYVGLRSVPLFPESLPRPIQERDQTFVIPAGIRPFLQPALDVDGRRVRGSNNELNRPDIVLLRLRPRPSVRVGDKCALVKGQHLTGLDIDREQAPSEIGGPPAPDEGSAPAPKRQPSFSSE